MESPRFAVPPAIPLYHITDVSNLPSILASGGVTCLNDQETQGIERTSIAHAFIQEKRARTKVPCGPGGVLHDYAPLFFCNRPPMLYSINRGNVVGRTQDQVIYLCTTVQSVCNAELDFVFTDGHGIIRTTRFFTDLARLDRVDWPLMTAKWWNDTQEDPDRMSRRQAEFLVHRLLPWYAIGAVVVQDTAMEAKVVELMQANGEDRSSPVRIQPRWYY